MNFRYRTNLISIIFGAVVLSLLASSNIEAQEGFEIVKVLDVGLNPHQISFSNDGLKALIASAGSDQVTIVDVATLEVERRIEVTGTPLGVIALPHSDDIAVTRFGEDEIARYDLSDGSYKASLTTGGGPSLLSGPLPGNRYLVSVEKTDQLWVLDANSFQLERSYDVGDRPFPPAATSDGRLAFVPGYDDSTVTVVDLWNERVLETVVVGSTPSGGVVLPGDIEYAVAVRGEDKVVFINTASHRITGSLSEGIGDSPFSVTLSRDGRLGFVNNTASHDISVFSVDTKMVIARIPVGEIPIVMGTHPSGETLWVSSEGSHTLSIIRIPPTNETVHDATSDHDEVGGLPEVAVMGMIHGQHPTSELWGLEEVKAAIRRFNPDVVCAEIPPDRWDRVWSDFTERGVFEDSRIRRFPEYTDAIIHLAVEMGFEVVPCAGWTQEMSDLRQTRIQEFETDPNFATARSNYEAELTATQDRYARPIAANEDPLYIHSDEYDNRMREELELYDKYQNDLIGPGGWTNINESHYLLIDRVIRENPGKRILITFGGGHKYWILDRLRSRNDISLLQMSDFLD